MACSPFFTSPVRYKSCKTLHTNMKYIATALLVFMVVGMTVCGSLLWRRRLETGDKSRHIQAILSWVSALFATIFIFRTWNETTAPDSSFFEPEHVFIPLLHQMTFFLYPLEVIHPNVSRTRVYVFLFAPLFLLMFLGMCSGIEYTTLHSYADIWQHIGEFNVWFRLLTLVIMLFYGFALFLVPYNWRESSADRTFIMKYALGFCLLGILHFSIQVFHLYWLQLVHQLVWISFFISVTYYELYERLNVPLKPLNAKTGEQAGRMEDKLWEQTLILLNSNGKWRSPELSLTSLAEQLESNRTYVGEAFKRNTGRTFVDYITRRRINYVVESLKQNPNANIYELFNYVGYRQRSTAWRNFQKITGFSPTEYVENLK